MIPDAGKDKRHSFGFRVSGIELIYQKLETFLSAEVRGGGKFET